jgi:RNA polymerase sigma-70 factor (ECF subfamily)
MSNFVVGRRYNNVVVSANIGTADSFEALFTANYARLARLIYRVVGDTGWAEDLAAEAFWKLHRNPPKSNHNLEGWLYRTGLRLALDDLKKRKRRAHYEALAPTPAAMQTPEQSAEQIEQQVRVRQVLAALQPDKAALLILRSEGCSLSEIASILSLKANSVGTLLARADAAFRKEYVNRYGER